MDFKIDNVIIKIRGIDISYVPKHLKVFLTEDSLDYNIAYEFHIVSSFPPIEGKKVFQNEDLLVLSEGALEKRALFVKGDLYPYAVTCERESNLTDVYIHKRILDKLNIDTIFLSLLSLERHLIASGAFILHCSYISFQNKAILFSAPSGTGKSTQALLWRDFMQAEIINGDRALICHLGGHWYAYGWPVCGSSEECLNQSKEINCLVFLGQSPSNTITKLNKPDSIKKVLSEATINYWNSSFTIKALDTIEKLVSEVPVYELQCTPDKAAVQCLYDFMEV